MSRETKVEIVTFGDESEKERRLRFVEHMASSPIPAAEKAHNAGMFLTPQTLSRVLFIDYLYRKILDVQGVIFDLGTRWGQNASLCTALRGIYEPFNRLRKVVAFDTFEGLCGTSDEDGSMMKEGHYAVSSGYRDYLESHLELMEEESPLQHLKKFEIVQGDVRDTLPDYLHQHPETVVALAYFDMDLYEPTKDALESIKPFITQGTVLAFDEANDPACPGETLAIREALGLERIRLRRYPHNSRTSYLVIE